jgi:hypothetical protein
MSGCFHREARPEPHATDHYEPGLNSENRPPPSLFTRIFECLAECGCFFGPMPPTVASAPNTEPRRIMMEDGICRHVRFLHLPSGSRGWL